MFDVISSISEACIIAYCTAFVVAGFRQAMINKEKAVGLFELIGMLWRGEVQPGLKDEINALRDDNTRVVLKNCELVDRIYILEEKLRIK
jgi:hypothetical protein